MGNTHIIKHINFEDMQTAIKNTELYLIVNTLPYDKQNCLILNTISVIQEENIINKHITQHNMDIRIIIYGENCNDKLVNKKYKQLISLGFYNVYIFSGGLFEWLMLQDIYGNDFFLTTQKEHDILKFKPQSMLNIALIEN